MRLSSLLLGFLAISVASVRITAQCVNQHAQSPTPSSETDPKQKLQDQPAAMHSDGDESTTQTKTVTPLASRPGAQAEKEDKAEHKWHVHLGAVGLSASYARFSNGFLIGPYWADGFYPYYFGYPPFFFDSAYSWPFYLPDVPNFDYGPEKGEIRLEAKPSSASVYLDDAYAGTAGKLKHFWLAPGAYDLMVAAADGSEFHQRIYVLSGKSMKIRAKFVPRNE
jgi:hypothetical protein